MTAKTNSPLTVAATWALLMTFSGCVDSAKQAAPFPPLIAAVEARDVERVEQLLEAGSDPNQSLETEVTALMVSVDLFENVPHRQERKLEGLKGPPVEDTRILELLLAFGADPNSVGGAQVTALNIAVYQGLTASVRVLLENGADPNISTSTDWSPLMLAAVHCYEDIAKLLIEYGANTTHTDSFGETAKSKAERENCYNVVRLLE